MVLMQLDNHYIHISVGWFILVKGISHVTFQPTTSLLKKYDNSAADECLITHSSCPIFIYSVIQIVGKTYPQAFTNVNIYKGFL